MKVARIRKRKHRNAQALLTVFSRHILLCIQLKKFIKNTVSRFRRRKAATLISLFVRRYLRERHSAICAQKKERAQALLSILCRRAFLTIRLKKFVRQSILDIHKRKKQKANALLSCFTRRVFLNIRLTKFARQICVRISKRKDRRKQALLSAFWQRTLLLVVMNKFVVKKVCGGRTIIPTIATKNAVLKFSDVVPDEHISSVSIVKVKLFSPYFPDTRCSVYNWRNLVEKLSRVSGGEKLLVLSLSVSNSICFAAEKGERKMV